MAVARAAIRAKEIKFFIKSVIDWIMIQQHQKVKQSVCAILGQIIHLNYANNYSQKYFQGFQKKTNSIKLTKYYKQHNITVIKKQKRDGNNYDYK